MNLELLKKKNELLARVLEITEAAVFTGGEDDPEVFIGLIEMRGEIFNQIKILDDEISDAALNTEAEAILADIKKTAGKIYAVDKRREAETARMMAGLKKSLKEIKDGRNVSQKYTDFIAVSDGMYFDKKN